MECDKDDGYWWGPESCSDVEGSSGDDIGSGEGGAQYMTKRWGWGGVVMVIEIIYYNV